MESQRLSSDTRNGEKRQILLNQKEPDGKKTMQIEMHPTESLYPVTSEQSTDFSGKLQPCGTRPTSSCDNAGDTSEHESIRPLQVGTAIFTKLIN